MDRHFWGCSAHTAQGPGCCAQGLPVGAGWAVSAQDGEGEVSDGGQRDEATQEMKNMSWRSLNRIPAAGTRVATTPRS